MKNYKYFFPTILFRLFYTGTGFVLMATFLYGWEKKILSAVTEPTRI